MASLDADRRRRRAELLEERASMLGWRDRLLARRRRHIAARLAWMRHQRQR